MSQEATIRGSEGLRLPGGSWGLGELHGRWLSQVAGVWVLAVGGGEELISSHLGPFLVLFELFGYSSNSWPGSFLKDDL